MSNLISIVSPIDFDVLDLGEYYLEMAFERSGCDSWDEYFAECEADYRAWMAECEAKRAFDEAEAEWSRWEVYYAQWE